MLEAVLAYRCRQTSVEQLCAELEIAVTTIYSWIELFKNHKQLLLGVLLDRVRMPKTFLLFLTEGPFCDYTEPFFLKYGFSFMQNLKTVYRPP
jgi:hypothetical protein